MPQEQNAYSSEDQRIDDYVRGKMSEEDEVSFEAEYLENPELLAKVEHVTRLREGLEALDTDQAAAQQKPRVERPAKVNWLRYLVVPQTAIGAIAATVLLTPFLFSTVSSNNRSHFTESALYNMSDVTQTRSDSTDLHRKIQLGAAQTSLIFKYDVAPVTSEPPQYEISIYSPQKKLLWKSPALYQDANSSIYVVVSRSILTPGRYDFVLTETGNGDEIVTVDRVEFAAR